MQTAQADGLDNQNLNRRAVNQTYTLASQQSKALTREARINPFERMFSGGFSIANNIHRINLERGDGTFSFLESGLPGLAAKRREALKNRKIKAMWDYIMWLSAQTRWQAVRAFITDIKQHVEEQLTAIEQNIAQLETKNEPSSLQDLLVAKWQKHKLQHVREDIDDLDQRAEKTQMPPSDKDINQYAQAASHIKKRTDDIVDTGLNAANDSKPFIFDRAAYGIESLSQWLRKAKNKPKTTERFSAWDNDASKPQQNNTVVAPENATNDIDNDAKPPQPPEDSSDPDEPQLA